MSHEPRYWRLKPGSTEYWEAYESCDEPHIWWEADVRWDGCTQLTRHFNMPADLRDESTDELNSMSDGIHLCDLDETIARLQELRELTRHMTDNR
jgi:hypothetical protein